MNNFHPCICETKLHQKCIVYMCIDNVILQLCSPSLYTLIIKYLFKCNVRFLSILKYSIWKYIDFFMYHKSSILIVGNELVRAVVIFFFNTTFCIFIRFFFLQTVSNFQTAEQHISHMKSYFIS